MAEIEFERRGTPLWAVLLGLIVIALVVWYFVAGREPAPGTATTTPPAPTTPAPGAATPAPAGAPTPAAERAPLALYSDFVERPAPSGGDAIPSYVADGLERLAAAMERQYPVNGVQVNLVRAMADSLRIPGTAPRRQTDMAQAAFFAAGFAMNKGNPSGKVTHAASQVQLDRTLAQQMPQVQNFFRAALEELRSPSPAATPGAAPGAAGGTKRP